MTDPLTSNLRLWNPASELPPRNVPVLCAWKRGDRWDYRVAKWGGKHWLDVLPETSNEYYTVPHFWQEIAVPGSDAQERADQTSEHVPLDQFLRYRQALQPRITPLYGKSSCGADPSVARAALESTDTAGGWRVDVYERDMDVWIRVIGPENQGAAFNTDGNSIRGVVLRQYRDAVKSSAVPEQTAHHWLPNIVGSWTCDWCGAIATCNPAATCAGRDAVITSASPADLVGALQDVVHTDTGPARAGRGVRISMLPNDLHPGPRCSCAECQGKYPTESEPDGI